MKSGTVLLAAWLSGCRTIGGLSSDDYPTKVYVGMQAHVESCGETEHGIPVWVLLFWDVPLSLALDTILLPGTLLYEVLRPRAEPPPVPDPRCRPRGE